MLKKLKSRGTVNGKTIVTIFILWLFAPVLGYISGYLHRSYFAFEKETKHVQLFRRFVHSVDVWILHGKVYHKSVFKGKKFVKVRF